MNERVNQSAEFEAEIKEKYEKWITFFLSKHNSEVVV